MTVPQIPTLVFAGECMAEFLRTGDEAVAHGYAGDTYNAAVYTARVARELDVPARVEYLTGIGSDPESQAMVGSWKTEGIRPRVLIDHERTIGRYEVLLLGAERSFTYERENSAARSVFQGVEWLTAFDGDVLFLSGITLQLMSPAAREALREHLRISRQEGRFVVFDTNFRPAGWASVVEARREILAVAGLAHTVFTSIEDEIALRGDQPLSKIVDALTRGGGQESILKLGDKGALLLTDNEQDVIPAEHVVAVDTTAAGDSLAGGYLAARLRGDAPNEALVLATRVAATVVQHRGAIVDSAIPLLGRPSSREFASGGPA